MRVGAIGGWRRIIAVGLPAALVALTGATTQWLRRLGAQHSRDLTQVHAEALHLADVMQHITDAESGERGFVLTGDERFVAMVDHARRLARAHLDTLRVMTTDDAGVHAAVGRLAREADQRFAELDQANQDRRANGRDSATNLLMVNRSHGTMDSVRVLAAAIRGEEERQLRAGAVTTLRFRSAITTVVVAGTTLAVLVALFVNSLLAGYARDQEQSAGQLVRQTHELEQQNTVLRRQADDLATANRDLESASVRLALAGAEAEDARRTAETASRAKSDFLATMSHELRTPLNAIVGYVALLEDGIRGPLSPAQATDLARIRRAGRHLLGLINDVLNFARLDAGQVEFDHTSVPVDDVLSGAAAMMEVQARAKAIALTRAPCDRGVTIAGDEEKILQIVVNLLSNAIKCTSPEGRIELICHASSDPIRITVSDTGCGIAAEHLARIFEPFVQVHRTLGAEGVGLGLAISRDLARAMGGDLTVESEAGVGSTFTLTMPSGARVGTARGEALGVEVPAMTAEGMRSVIGGGA